MLADDVEKLLDNELLQDGTPDGERAFSRAKCLEIIHATLWAHGARSGSTASAYAIHSLFDALGLESWSFKEPESAAAETECVVPAATAEDCSEVGGVKDSLTTEAVQAPGVSMSNDYEKTEAQHLDIALATLQLAKIDEIDEYGSNCILRAEEATAVWHDLCRLREWIKQNAEHAMDCTGFLAKIEDDGSETDLPCTCGLRELVPDFDSPEIAK